ncbi:MAG: class aldolase/adducin-like protein [Rhodospirillales bacterium]|nr:class aldolase/adducin-like protein [Rhodospirillales bacterium]
MPMMLSDADPTLVEELVAANRILFDQGVVDGFGHVSVRHDKHPDRYILSRSMAPALVTAADLIEFNLDSSPVSDQRQGYLERFIHGEIFRARPDVMCVIHSHSPSVIPFGIVEDVPLRPVFHMSGFLGLGAPIFEIRDIVGPGSDMLIRDRNLGIGLAKVLGAGGAVLMRGHGSTVVGQTLRQTVYRAVYAEVNARLQAEALRLGKVNYLTAEEAAAASAMNDSTLNRAWDLWKTKALAAH